MIGYHLLFSLRPKVVWIHSKQSWRMLWWQRRRRRKSRKSGPSPEERATGWWRGASNRSYWSWLIILIKAITFETSPGFESWLLIYFIICKRNSKSFLVQKGEIFCNLKPSSKMLSILAISAKQSFNKSYVKCTINYRITFKENYLWVPKISLISAILKYITYIWLTGRKIDVLIIKFKPKISWNETKNHFDDRSPTWNEMERGGVTKS